MRPRTRGDVRRNVPRPTTRSALARLLPDPSRGDHATVEALTHVLTEEPLPSFADASIDAVLDAYLSTDCNGKNLRLVPGKVAELVDLNGATTEQAARRRHRAQLLDGLRADAWADGTLLSYGGHVKAWRQWCRDEGVPALPFDPWQVANFLLDYTFEWDDETADFARDTDGGLMPRVCASTVGSCLSALNRAAEFIGLPRPGDNPGVMQLMRGVRTRLGIAPQTQRAPLDLDNLHRCLAATTGQTFAAARTRAAVLIRARCRATARQLSLLEWADVALHDDHVVLELARASRHGLPVSITLSAHRNPSLCPVNALRNLRSLAGRRLTRVFAHRDGRPLSRQAIHLAVNGATVGAGSWEGLPTMTDRALAVLVAEGCPAAPLASTRDAAVLLVGFWTALRRSNLSSLNWCDVTDHGGDGFAVRVRRSKTDREGRGRTIWLPAAAAGQSQPCPSRALRQWRQQLTAALGRPPLPDEPVFVRLTANGAVQCGAGGRPLRLSGDGINDAVQRLAVAAGLMDKPAGTGGRAAYGAHSLRAGYVTEALRDDKLSIAEVAEVTGHKSVRVLIDYRREVNAAKRNPSRKMFGMTD